MLWARIRRECAIRNSIVQSICVVDTDRSSWLQESFVRCERAVLYRELVHTGDIQWSRRIRIPNVVRECRVEDHQQW